jgi:hypothetical protein
MEEDQSGGELRLIEMTATVETIREDVAAGRLALDPEAGDRILSMLRDQLARVDTWLRRAQGLARRAPLGENPVGQAMAGKFEHRAGATDDDMSLAGVLVPYRQVLLDAHDAVDQAMRAYQQVEGDHVRLFRKLAAEQPH